MHIFAFFSHKIVIFYIFLIVLTLRKRFHSSYNDIIKYYKSSVQGTAIPCSPTTRKNQPCEIAETGGGRLARRGVRARTQAFLRPRGVPKGHRAHHKKSPARLRRAFSLMILVKKIVGGAFQDIADGLEIFKFDARGLVVDDFIKVLIAQSQLNVKPILGFSLFGQDVQNSQPHHITSTLLNVLIIDQKFA